jgi:hypothetical protein
VTNKHGDFIWYELMTTDPDAATRFYGSILGWSVAASEQPDMDYRIFSAGPEQVGGFMALTPEMTEGGAQPCWAGYIAVDNTDAAAAAIKSAGGQVLMGPNDIPGIGRFAFVADPQGALFYVMTDSSGQESHAFAAYEPKAGHCAWNELATSDPEAAIAFYAEQFGWSKDSDMDMGPMGTYHMMKAGGGRFMVGGIMRKVPEDPQSHWLHYFRVEDIDAAAERIAAYGGRIHIPAMEIPGGEYSLAAADPDGAYFGLVGPRNK